MFTPQTTVQTPKTSNVSMPRTNPNNVNQLVRNVNLKGNEIYEK